MMAENTKHNRRSSGRGNKREAILSGALKVFARKGFFQSKIAEIARESGVADGTIYLYFEGKDDILISLFEERMEELVQAFKQATHDVSEVLDKIRVYVERHLHLAVTNPDLAQLFTIQLRQSTRFMTEYKNEKFREYLGHLESLIAQGQRDGCVRTDVSARWIARLLFGALDELLLAISLSRRTSHAEVSALAKSIADILIQGIAKPAVPG